MRSEPREEGRDAAAADAADVRVARVVAAEVVPHDTTARPQHADDLARDARRHAAIEDRREDGEDEHEVERRVGPRE